MNCTECTARLHDYVDGDLSADHTRAVESHVTSCARCRAELASLRALLGATQKLGREIAPTPDLWPSIQDQILTQSDVASSRLHARQSRRDSSTTSGTNLWSETLRWLAPLGMAATIVIVAGVAERKIAPRADGPAWSVAALAGTPQVDSRTVRAEAKFRLGQFLETDAASRAKVSVGSIGEVNVEPNSRLRLVGMAADNHRLELARGTMSALIWAPPRLFFVNTPSATAVDLGCAYTLNVDDHGNGELLVSAGYVALEDGKDGKRDAIIRSGMKCLTRRGAGPGTPFAVDAPETLRTALERFDFQPGAANAALTDILANARPEDAVTLWHLLTRTEGAQRVEVYELLAKLAPPPDSITRAGILAGDVTMRRMWGTELGLHRY